MANNYSANLRIMVGKVETTSGTMETLSDADFNVRIRGVEFTPTIEADDEGSKWMNGNHGEDEMIPGVKTGQITFTCRAAVASAVAVTPTWWKFAQGCGAEVIAYGSTGKALQPRKSKDEVTMTLWIYDIQRGGTGNAVCYKFAGCSGNMVLGAESVGKPWLASFTYTGKFVECVDVLAASIPSPYGLDTTCADRLLMDSVYVDSVAQKISSFSLDIGSEVQAVFDQSDASGISHYGIVNRKPRLSLNPLMTSVTGFDLFTKWTGGATGCPDTFPMHIGDTGANTKYALMVPKGQILNASVANREGLVSWDQNYRLLGNGVTGALADEAVAGEVTWELLSGTR